jgi:hypothetical protein
MTRLESKEVKHKDYDAEAVLMANPTENSFTGFCIGRLTAKQVH